MAEVLIKGTPEEIAALVLAVQERQNPAKHSDDRSEPEHIERSWTGLPIPKR